MNNLMYQLLLMIAFYILTGCIIYLLAQKEDKSKITNGKQLFYLLSGYIFKPIIKTCICLDLFILLHMELKDRLNGIYEMIMEREHRKPTRAEKKEIKDLLKKMICEGDKSIEE